ncbi:uncharacterized protein LOC141866453 [Acropora palmata]|uniref:uncharacterized protein LOC141866453 n=1 Tax=Acropora palmata TaxID=6131 RepID=UPI003DA023E5
MSSVHYFESSSIFKTPVSADLLANKCDSCGKTFSHSSSYRRHIRTSCRAQKRRRLLWLPEEGESEELDSDEDGISALSDGSFAENADGSPKPCNLGQIQESSILHEEDTMGNEEEPSFQEVSESEQEASDIPTSSNEEPISDDEDIECNSLHWSEEDVQGLMQDINEPLPEPPIEKSRLSQVNLLLRWLCCFILYWQVVTRVSDSTVEWPHSVSFKVLGSIWKRTGF